MSVTDYQANIACPNCGGTNLHVYKKDGKFDWKKGLIGAALTGGIGIVAGAVGYLNKGETYVCNDCGYSNGAATKTPAIKESQLTSIREPYRSMKDITFSQITAFFSNEAKKYNIPVAFRNDSIQCGTVLTPSSKPCLVVFHPVYASDYMSLCITRHSLGNICTISTYTCGRSKQLEMSDYNNRVHVFDGSAANGVILGALAGNTGFASGAAGYGIGRGVVVAGKKILNAVQADSQAAENEKAWYTILGTILDDIFS